MNQIIIEKNIRRRKPIYIKKGKHRGKIGGYIIYEDWKMPYYFVQKNYKQNQMWRNFSEMVSVSQDIIEKLVEEHIPNILFQFIGFEAESFFVEIPTKDFLKGKLFTYDNPQYCVYWTKYKKICWSE